VKLLPILAAVAVALPVAANAQSLKDTHDLVWHPSGKTPAATYRPRAKPACTQKFDQDAASKDADRAAGRCVAAKTAPWSATSAN
jgi:hypothetical protein